MKQLKIVNNVATTLGGLEFHGEVLNLPAEGKNHDAYLVANGFVGIADGSTPLIGAEKIDAHGYALGALERLCQYHTLSPIEMFRCALSMVDRPNLPISRTASCTVAALAVADQELNVSVLGDCIGLIRSVDDNSTVVWDQRLGRFDDPVAEQMARDIAQGMSLEEARDAANERLIVNRDHANSNQTYWLFADDPAAADRIKTASVDLSQADEIFLCSDGFSRLIDPFQVVNNAAGLLTLAKAKGLAQLGRELRLLEQTPKSLVEYPRLDLSDDATAIMLRRS